MEVQPGRTLQNLYHSLVIIVLYSGFFVIGRSLFVPLFYGLFIAIVLFPFCKKWKRTVYQLLSVVNWFTDGYHSFAALLTFTVFPTQGFE